jgi:hypothetical protein
MPRRLRPADPLPQPALRRRPQSPNGQPGAAKKALRAAKVTARKALLQKNWLAPFKAGPVVFGLAEIFPFLPQLFQ